MKKTIISFCLILLVISAGAKNIHWLLFVDTTDPNVGRFDITGRQVLLDHFVNEVNAAMAPTGYASKIYDYYGSRTTPENCKAAIEMLNVSTEDIIVFYYIGHGGRPNISDTEYLKRNPWPQMCMAQHNQDKYIPLKWVDDQLSSKGARLSITIGMCCNSLSPNIRVKNAPLFSANYGATYMSGNKLRLIQQLFLNYKGSLLATSASPIQSSYVWENGILSKDSPFGEIDFYTAILSLFFDTYLDNKSSISWKEVMDQISKTIDYITGSQQSPIYDDTRLSLVEAPKPSMPKEPSTKPTPSSKGDDVWKNNLSEYLDAIINTSNSVRERRELETKMNQMFAPGAIVRMMSQDSDIVVEKEDAPDFLGRLATSTLLLKVAIVDGTFDDNNKITSLKVKEIYKQ